MATKIVNVDPTRDDRIIPDLAITVLYGETAEIEDQEMAERLLAQDTVWARPNSNAGKDATAWAKRHKAPAPDPQDPTSAAPAEGEETA